MNVESYLKRIGVDSPLPILPTYENLCMLQLRHILSVPYENIDILLGKPLSLSVDDIYEKVVINNRGGYCFELNCLFEALLRELGYETESFFARFWRGENGIPHRRHRVIAVKIDGKRYVADVGIGSAAPRKPLPLMEFEEIEAYGEKYRMVRDSEFGWMIYEYTHGGWSKYFSFTEEKQYESDFVFASFFCEKHPESKFNKSLIVALKTETGRISFDGNCYKEFKGADLGYIEENIPKEKMIEILRSKFSIYLSDLPFIK